METVFHLVKKQEDKPLEASKWQDLHLLLSPEELKRCIYSLDAVYLYPISRTLSEEPTLEDFFTSYRQYIEALKKGALPSALQAYVLSSSLEALYACQIAEGKFLARAYLPAVFVRPHSFIFSPLDRKFRSKVYGQTAITWGYTFSYPQFCIDPHSNDAAKVDGKYVNTALFKRIQRWVREYTLPTPFLYEEVLINAPLRIGEECLAWINNHPQLKSRHLYVENVS